MNMNQGHLLALTALSLAIKHGGEGRYWAAHKSRPTPPRRRKLGASRFSAANGGRGGSLNCRRVV